MKNKLLIALAIAAIGIQFVPVERTNPPVRSDLRAPAAVKEILVRSCYDCHSNETTWPWYARVAPVSWFVADHVAEGRAELNFSEWGSYDTRRQAHLGAEILEAVEKRKMPLPTYIYLHPEAKLVGSELETLRGWRP